MVEAAQVLEAGSRKRAGKGWGPSPEVPKVNSSSPAQKPKSKVSSEVQGKLTAGSSRKNTMSRTSRHSDTE